VTRALIVFFAFLALASGSVASTEQLPAQQAYVQAVNAMNDLPQPEYVTYDWESDGDGLQVDLTESHGNVYLHIHTGSSSATWPIQHRTFDYRSEIATPPDAHEYVTERSFFDPTWYGAYRALREGMLAAQDPAPPRENLAGMPSAPPAILRTIAVTSVMGPTIYNVDDRGSAACPGGSPGRALHLTSRDHDPGHQLSDVTIDLKTSRFCMLRFHYSDHVFFNGIVESYYGNVGGYWMQTGGLLDGTQRILGFSNHHGVWRYRFTDMQFPRSLTSDAFQEGPEG